MANKIEGLPVMKFIPYNFLYSNHSFFKYPKKIEEIKDFILFCQKYVLDKIMKSETFKVVQIIFDKVYDTVRAE